jgi:hypothetical protein
LASCMNRKISSHDEVVLMSDYNQSLSVAEASSRAAALEGEGLYWIEEPTRADTVPWSSGAKTRYWCSWERMRLSTIFARRGRWKDDTAR